MSDFLRREWKFLFVMAIVVGILGVAWYEYRQYKEQLLSTPKISSPQLSINTSGALSKANEPKLVYLQGENTHTKEIVYVPKEIDPKTGQLENTDVQFEKKQGTIYVKINGKEYAVPADVKEDTKFNKGKLVITEQTEMRINITAPKPSINMGIGWSKRGPAAQLNGPLYKNVSWWAYGDRETVAGGIQFPIVK